MSIDSDIGLAHSGRRFEPAVRKVPEITVYFWAIKVLTTAMGGSPRTTWFTSSTPRS